jgi:hypothetical protein
MPAIIVFVDRFVDIQSVLDYTKDRFTIGPMAGNIHTF